MADKKSIYGKQMIATVGKPLSRAPSHKDVDLRVFLDFHVDDPEGPTANSIKSGSVGAPILVPYPEARWWSEKLSNGLVNDAGASPSIDTPILDLLGAVIVDAAGNAIIA